MKLYEVPRNTNIRVVSDVKVPPDASDIKPNDVLRFYDIDGMYSYCTNAEGEVVHLAAWTEVEIIE